MQIFWMVLANEYAKFATKKWYVTDSESKGAYSHENTINFATKSIESSLCDYSDAYILVTGNIVATGGDNNTKVAFKSCAPFRKCRIKKNETFVDDAEYINIARSMYNFIEYSDNYSDTSKGLWQFKRDKQHTNNNGISIDLTAEILDHLNTKSNLIGNTDANGANRKKEGVKIVVPLIYLSNFWRSLEMPLTNCKVELSLTWNKKCILSSSGTDASFTITDSKLYVPVVTL